MLKINQIINHLEAIAPLHLQENYDNAGLIIGEKEWECTGIICTLDVTEEVVQEAYSKKCNLIIAHHPIVFKGLKRLNGNDYVEKTIIAAIKKDIAIYAIHTNLDNIIDGVSGRMASKLGLKNVSVLAAQNQVLRKLTTFVPLKEAEKVRNAIFKAGGGDVGNYSNCSFNTEGVGSFKAGENANPVIGEIGQTHFEKETRIETVFPVFLEKEIIVALKAAHPYEEVAYDIVTINNEHQGIGSGVIGDLAEPMDELNFLDLLENKFKLKVIRHTKLLNKKVQKIALCGGAGSFLIGKALASKSDFYVSADIKYHEFFDANDRMVIADIGHFESEQFTIDQLYEILHHKFPTFAILKTEVKTNPVHYFSNVKS